MNDDQKKKTDEAIDNSYKVIEADEINFETKITYINAGAIGLILTFLPNTDKPICLWLLYCGVVLCGLSLALNMSSYLKAKRWHRRNIKRLYERIINDVYFDTNKLTDRVTKRIDIINCSCLVLMLLGMILLIIFTFKNI